MQARRIGIVVEKHPICEPSDQIVKYARYAMEHDSQSALDRRLSEIDKNAFVGRMLRRGAVASCYHSAVPALPL